MKKLIAIAIAAASSYTLAATPSLEETLVTAELRETPWLELAASASIFDSEHISKRQATHLEDMLALAPNVNFAQGASRGRFIQIRGIGRRSEFTNPINHSVGIIVDGIDFTTIGSGVSSLDVGQIEILRGPQGTVYGANALAGLINVTSNKPTDELEGEVSVGLGNYDRHEAVAVVNTPINDTLAARFAVQQFSQDGFVDNIHLGRSDTNNIDELSLKSVIAFTPSENLSLNTTVFYFNADNGYDSFSLDNNRNTYSDQPGEDQQETLAVSSRLNVALDDSNSLDVLVSASNSDLTYSYDEDWAYNNLCVDFTCIFDGYSSFDRYDRDNSNYTLDARWLGEMSEALEFIVGVYLREQSVDLDRTYSFDAPFSNQYDTTNVAIYGQADVSVSEATTITAGLRLEQREADYSDNRDVSFSPSDDLWGGKISIQQQLNEQTMAYALVSRGYTTGGFNINGGLPAQFREYDMEYQWNYELGLKGSLESLSYAVAVFYQDRSDVHTNQSFVTSIATGEIDGTCPCAFTDYVDNAATATSLGFEGELQWQASQQLAVFANLGLLKAEFDDYNSFSHLSADTETGTPYDLNGRSVAHAPHWQYHTGAIFTFIEGVSAQLDVEGKDSFYLSDRHQEKSDSYTLVNAQISYELDNWLLTVWGKNLGDKDTQTRGFGSFGNDPRKGYATEPYYQYGAPRTFGANVRYQF